MPEPDTSMAGKVCLITGATAGIGEYAARDLARRGATVVIIGRDHEKCARTVNSIRRATNNPDVNSITADLSSQSDIRRAAREFLARHDQLHILINNAGAIFTRRRESVDRIEMTLALNHLAYFLLTNLLLDALKAAAPGRIINVASDSHEMVKAFDFEDPQALTSARGRRYVNLTPTSDLFYTLLAPRSHPALVQYAHSKLANILFTHELARRLAGTGVTANSLHPGFVATQFTSGHGIYRAFMRFWSRFFAIPIEEGAQTPIYLATSADVESTTAKYFIKQHPTLPSPASRDHSAAQRLWTLSEELTRHQTTA